MGATGPNRAAGHVARRFRASWWLCRGGHGHVHLEKHIFGVLITLPSRRYNLYTIRKGLEEIQDVAVADRLSPHGEATYIRHKACREHSGRRAVVAGVRDLAHHGSARNALHDGIRAIVSMTQLLISVLKEQRAQRRMKAWHSTRQRLVNQRRRTWRTTTNHRR